MLTELQRPAMEREQAEQEEQTAFLIDRAKTLQNNLLDPNTIEFDFSKTSNPEAARKQALAMAYVRLQNGGKPIPGGKVGYQITRDRIAKERFNGAGAGDDLAFFDQIQSEATQNKAKLDLARKVQEDAVANTFKDLFASIRTGPAKPWKEQLEEIKKSPGYVPGNEFRYMEIANTVRDEILTETAKDRGFYIQLFNAITAPAKEDNAAFRNAEQLYLEKVESIKDPTERAEMRDKFRRFMTNMVSLLPDEDRGEAYDPNMPGISKNSFLGQMNIQSRRSITDIGRNIAGGKEVFVTVQTDDGEVILGPSNVDPKRSIKQSFKLDGKTVSEEELYQKAMVQNEKEFEARNFADDMQAIRRNIYAPIEKKWGDGVMGDIESGIYAMPGAVSTTAIAAIPYVGQALTFKMLQGAAATDMRQQLMLQGVSDIDASRIADDNSAIIGAIQYIPERIGAKAVTRRIPWLEKVHTSISNKITNRLMRGVVTGAGVGSVELGTELFQNQVPNVMQDVIAELDATVPGTDWEKEMDGFWSETITTAVAILPLAMIGAAGGVNSEARAQAFAELPSRVRLAYGITPEADAAIELAKQQGPESINKAVLEAQESRDPRSESAMDAVQEIAEEMETARAAAAEMEKSELFPLINYDTESKVYTLIDKNTNEEIGQAQNPESAVRLAAAWNESIELEESDYLTYLTTTLQGATESAQLDADQNYPDLNQRKTSYTFDLARTYTAAEAAAESEGNANRVAEQLRLKESAATGSSDVTNVVFGQSITDPLSMSRKYRETTNRIYRGASILTVFHEETHGFWREAISTGRIEKTEAVGLLKALDQLAGTITTKSGEAARYLPADFDSMTENEQETAIDEAIAELMEAEILRTRKGGGVRATSKGLVSRNLSALARLAGDKTVGKFKAFIDAVRSFFGITMDRALILKRGIADGSIDKAEYESFLNRLYGLTEQAEFDRFQAEAEADIVNDAFNIEDAIAEDFPDGAPFSIATLSNSDLKKLRDLGPEGYAKEVNKSGKWHPSDAYKTTANKLNTYTRIEDYPTLIETFNGVEYRRSDKPLKYVKPNEDGFAMREENGNAIYLTEDEIAEKGLKSKSDDLAAFIDGKAVGMAADEWGAILVLVAKEYQNKGIGTKLTTIYRTANPWKDSGGFTNAGMKQIRRVYDYLIGEKKFIETDPISLNHIPIIASQIEVENVEVSTSHVSWAKWVRWEYKGEEFQNRMVHPDEIDAAGGAENYAKQQTATALINREEANTSFSIGNADVSLNNFIKNSKVINSDGSAKIVYHGSPDIRGILKEGFQKSLTRGDVFFFSDDYRTADTYADDRRALDYQNAEPYTLPVYLSLKNPLVIDANGKKWRDTEFYIKQARKDGKDGIIILNSRDEYNNTKDGGKPVTVYAVFSPQQIKSASQENIKSRIDNLNLGPASFSIGQARLADLLSEDAYRRIRNPEARAKALSRITRELARLRTEAEKLEVMMGSKRMAKSLRREAAVRQAMRQEELENQALARHQGILSDDELSILSSYPLHSQLIREVKQSYVDKDGKRRSRIIKKGVLMSRTQAAKRHPDMFSRDKAGEYDGAEGMSPIIYGGSRTPDEVAQDFFDQGLIADPYPDTLWEALRAEQNTVGKMKEALAAAKEDLRAARATAISETKAWMESQVNIQENTYSQKEEILRASALLDAILAALPAQLRGQIGGYTPLARLGSNESRLSFLMDRLATADRLLEKYLRKQFDREFRLLLDRARPEKDEAGKRPKGKLGSNVHELFDDIRDAMLLNATEVEALVASLDVLATNPDNTPEQQAHATLASNLVSLAGNWSNADAARMEIALKEAQQIYNRGYGEAMVEAKRKAERRQAARDTFRTATASDGHRMDRVKKAIKENTRRNLPKQFLQSLYSFEQVMQLAFGKNLPELKSLVEWERRASNAKHDAITNKTQLIEQLFADLAGSKYKGEQLRWEMSQPGTIKAKDGFGVEQTFSVLEAITATMLWRQEDGRRHMEGHRNENGQPTGSWNWTDEAIDQIEKQLNGNAQAVRLHLSTQYAAEYDRLNAIYKSLYGVSLPQHKFYSPITVKPVQAQAGQTIDPVTGALTSGNMMSPGSLKTRSQSAIAEPDFRDALQTYIAHTMQMEHWMAYAPFAIEAQAVFGNRELRNSVEASAGKETLTILSSWLDYFAQGGTRDAAAHLGLTKAMNRALGRAASVALVGRLSVLVIQSTQILAAAHAMPMGAFVTRFAKLLTGQLGWGTALKSDYIRRRMEQMPPVVRQSMEALAYAKPSRLKYLAQKMGQTISGADAIFTGGTYAITYDYHFTRTLKDNPNMSEAEATKIAEREAEAATDRIAQPTKAATRSLLEVTSTNPFMRLAWSFASEPRQKLALSAFAFSSETTVGEKSRALFVTWIAGGLIASLIRSAIADLRSDEDDEWFDERNWDPKRIALQTLTGPFAGIPIIGDSVEAAAFSLAGVWMPEGNLFSAGQRGLEAATNIPEWFTGERDFIDAITDAEKIISGAGIFSGNAAAAASLSHVVVDAFKVIDNLIDED